MKQSALALILLAGAATAALAQGQCTLHAGQSQRHSLGQRAVTTCHPRPSANGLVSAKVYLP